MSSAASRRVARAGIAAARRDRGRAPRRDRRPRGTARLRSNRDCARDLRRHAGRLWHDGVERNAIYSARASRCDSSRNRLRVGRPKGGRNHPRSFGAREPHARRAAAADEVRHRVAPAAGGVVERYMQRMGIKATSADQRIRELSGGNQQKVLLARWLCTEPRLLILDEPTRGIDIGAKGEIQQLVNELAESGVGILMISSELEELVEGSSRVVVLRDGRNVAELRGDEISEQAIIHAMAEESERELASDARIAGPGVRGARHARRTRARERAVHAELRDRGQPVERSAAGIHGGARRGGHDVRHRHARRRSLGRIDDGDCRGDRGGVRWSGSGVVGAFGALVGATLIGVLNGALDRVAPRAADRRHAGHAHRGSRPRADHQPQRRAGDDWRLGVSCAGPRPCGTDSSAGAHRARRSGWRSVRAAGDDLGPLCVGGGRESGRGSSGGRSRAQDARDRSTRPARVSRRSRG